MIFKGQQRYTSRGQETIVDALADKLDARLREWKPETAASEMGIRIALGAQRKHLLQLVLVDGLRPAFIGLALGLVASAVLTQLIRSMLYQTEPLDPVVFVVVGFVLLLVPTAAGVIPAWRASQVDPIRALRA